MMTCLMNEGGWPKGFKYNEIDLITNHKIFAFKQYERKCIELTQRLEEAINCHRKEKQRRKWYQSKLEG